MQAPLSQDGNFYPLAISQPGTWGIGSYLRGVSYAHRIALTPRTPVAGLGSRLITDLLQIN
jgi:hypothetical protein